LNKFLLPLSLCLLAFSTPAQAQQKPNIIVILADDLGYGDVSFNGSLTDDSTPNIDSIAQNGALCTNGYITHPFCSPSRAALLTGRYQQRFGHENQPDGDPSNPRLGLPASEVLLPQLLKPAGYVCGAIGKWHLGYTPNFRPLSRGFDEFFGFLAGASPYYNAKLFRNQTTITETSYLTDAFTREAVSFINRHAIQPFFLYLAYNAVHAPYDIPPSTYMNRVANITDSKRRIYAAMVTALDDGVGQILQALQTNRILDNTIVFFLSDNGAPQQSFTRNTPLRGYKLDTLEGGIRVPYAVQWPGHLSHAVYSEPVSSLDIVATATAAAGVSLPSDRPYDGLDILPYLTGQQNAPERTLFWRWFGLGKSGPPGSLDTIWAVRSGPMKLVLERAKVDQPPALYDLPNDIGEARNLASTRPSEVDALNQLYANWNTELIFPLWEKKSDFQIKQLVLAGDWNRFNKADNSAPWQLTWTSAPAVDGTPDAFKWFSNTIYVARTGGDTTPGKHSFALVGGATYSNQWGGPTVGIDAATTLPFFSGKSLGPTSDISFQDGFYYSFRILEPPLAVPINLKVAVLKTSGPPITVSRTAQAPTTPTSSEPTAVSIATTYTKSAEERIFLRWSKDFFITSHLVPATGAGTNYSATIPAQPAGTAVQYTVVTSTVDLSSYTASGAIDALALSTTPVFKVVTSQ
jgi:arylsulfatase A-like enzyme